MSVGQEYTGKSNIAVRLAWWLRWVGLLLDPFLFISVRWPTWQEWKEAFTVCYRRSKHIPWLIGAIVRWFRDEPI